MGRVLRAPADSPVWECDFNGAIKQSGKQEFFRHHWNTVRTKCFDKSRFVMTFLTVLEVTEILCSFRLVLEGKTGLHY